MSETSQTAAPIDTKLADLTAAHAQSTAAITDLTTGHEANVSAISRIADTVETLGERVDALAKSGVLGTAAQAGEAVVHPIVQEIINFLHWAFPGHNVPGKVAVIDPPAEPATGA
jgi:hypothetical protein